MKHVERIACGSKIAMLEDRNSALRDALMIA